MSADEALSLKQRLALAKEQFRIKYASCFWYMPRDLVISEEMLPSIARALRKNGSREDYLIARSLCP